MNADPRQSRPRLTAMEDPACGLHRIAMLEIAAALRMLDEPGPDPATAIHECRKAIKRTRALARLARHRDPVAARRIDKLLRRAGRALSGRRDAEVVVTTARGLEPARVTGAVAAALHASTGKTRADGQRKAAASLAQARRRFGRLFDGGSSWRSDELMIAAGDELDVLHERAMRYLDGHTEADAHELRKSVQRCLAQLRIISELTRADLDDPIGVLHELAQKLGTHHDLTVLREALKSVPKSTLLKADRQRLRKSARARQHDLDADVKELLAGFVGTHSEMLRSALTAEALPVQAGEHKDPGDASGRV